MKKSKKYLAILALIPVLFYFWPSSLGGNTDYISVYGESMVPTMENGALAVLKQDTNYEISDIVAYRFTELGVNKIIIHRIIATTEDSFILKGDNNRSKDPEPVKTDQIIGKLLFQVPYVGYIPTLLKNPLVLILTMMAIAFFAMLDKKKKDAEVKEVVVPKNSPKKKEKTAKRSKHISLFLPALILNMAYYVLGQYSISVEILPPDGYAAFLHGIIDPYLAGTIVFSTWFGVIMGSYVLSRYSISLEYRKNNNAPSGIVQMRYLRIISFKTVAQLFWMIFTGYYGLYMFVLISNLR